MDDLEKAETQEEDLPHLLIVSYVSRGDNREALRRSIEETQEVFDRMVGISYEIEVVTDIEVPDDHRVSETNGLIHYCLVPGSYQTKRRVKYKDAGVTVFTGEEE